MTGSRHTPSGRAPVLCLAFNRPDLFERVIAAVREAGSRELFISIDGPRPDRPQDAALCARVRKVAGEIDWAADLRLKVEARNLGCGPAVSSAISWALNETPELIILEDDCVPDPSFLQLCDELLPRYRDDERVMQIAGTNWGVDPDRFSGYSYAFTSFAPIWGWATWRRAWDLYDYELESWPRMKATGLADGIHANPRFRRLLHKEWDRVHAGGGTWDNQWVYTVLRHHGLSVCPRRNLVKNVGFRSDATQIGEHDRVFGGLPLEWLEFPLRHPPEVARNASVEAVFERIYWRKRGWPAELFARSVRSPRLRRGLREVLGRFLPRPS